MDIHTYVHTVYVCTYILYTVYIKTQSDNALRLVTSRLVTSLNSSATTTLGNNWLMHTCPYTEQRACRGTNKEYLTSSLKRHGPCAHSGVVMSREVLTLCACFLRGGGCRSVSGAVSCGQVRELSMTRAHLQKHTKAMSCHLYTCTCK